MQPRVPRSYDASVVALVHDIRSCPREDDRSLVGMDAAGWIGIVAPLVSYFGPSRAFVIRAVKSLVASENDLWVDGVHGEHGKADITAAGGAAVGRYRRARRVVVCANVARARALGRRLRPR